jgi:hypothetical protein
LKFLSCCFDEEDFSLVWADFLRRKDAGELDEKDTSTTAPKTVEEPEDGKTGGFDPSKWTGCKFNF